MRMKASEESVRNSKSLLKGRKRWSQAKVRSRTQRRGRRAKPLRSSLRRTISSRKGRVPKRPAIQSAKFAPGVTAVSPEQWEIAQGFVDLVEQGGSDVAAFFGGE